jgi:cell division topological specificity factor
MNLSFPSALVQCHDEGSTIDRPDFLPALQGELLAVIAKYISVDKENIKVSMERRG